MKSEERLYERIWKKKGIDKEPRIEKGSRVDIALKLLDKGERLLDIGCGDGTLGYFAKNKYKEVYGVDISEEALKIAEKRGIIVKKVNLNEEKLPFENEYFDAVTCLDVIEHVFEPRDLIMLKRGGILIISTPNIRYWRHLFSLTVKGRFPKTSGDTELWDGGYLHYFTYKDIELLLSEHGFEVLVKRGVFGREFLKESPGIIIKGRKI